MKEKENEKRNWLDAQPYNFKICSRAVSERGKDAHTEKQKQREMRGLSGLRLSKNRNANDQRTNKNIKIKSKEKPIEIKIFNRKQNIRIFDYKLTNMNLHNCYFFLVCLCIILGVAFLLSSLSSFFGILCLCWHRIVQWTCVCLQLNILYYDYIDNLPFGFRAF